MLRSVLHAIESANGPVHVAALSQQLGIDRAALEGMISYWVQKGRLQDLDAVAACEQSHDHKHCGSGCSGGSCNFVARMPKSYTIHLSPSVGAAPTDGLFHNLPSPSESTTKRS